MLNHYDAARHLLAAFDAYVEHRRTTGDAIDVDLEFKAAGVQLHAYIRADHTDRATAPVEFCTYGHVILGRSCDLGHLRA